MIATLTSGLAPYLRPAPLAVLFLGLSSGFPLALVLSTLTYWLSKLGIEKSTVGLFALATVPYALKFLWSPFLDRLRLPFSDRFGQRRMWLWTVQVLLLGALIGLGFSDPVDHIIRTAIWVLIVAFLSASQDILIDAYRIEILDDDELAYGSATINFGYRTGLLITGAGTVLLSNHVGWPVAYALSGLMILPGAITALLFGEPTRAVAARAAEDERDEASSVFTRTVIAPFRSFLSIDGALMIIAFIAIYKVGDALANVMLAPLVVDLGFTDNDWVYANKVLGFWALIAGTALGPPLLKWMGMAKALFVTGLFMMVTNVMFAVFAAQGTVDQGNAVWLLGLTVGLENFSSGAGLAVFTTYISGLCNMAFTGTHYAIVSSIAVIGRTFVASTAGFLATSVGWVWFFLLTTLAALPGLALLFVLWRRGHTGEGVRTQASSDKGISRWKVLMFMMVTLAVLLLASLWRFV